MRGTHEGGGTAVHSLPNSAVGEIVRVVTDLVSTSLQHEVPAHNRTSTMAAQVSSTMASSVFLKWRDKSVETIKKSTHKGDIRRCVLTLKPPLSAPPPHSYVVRRAVVRLRRKKLVDCCTLAFFRSEMHRGISVLHQVEEIRQEIPHFEKVRSPPPTPTPPLGTTPLQGTSE